MEHTTSYINYAGLLEFMYLKHENTDLYLSHCGMQQCTPGHCFEHRPRPEYHLHFILDGQGMLKIQGREYHLSRGQIFVIPPNVENYSYQADRQRPWYYAWAAFSGAMAEYYMRQAGFHGTNAVLPSNIPPEEFTSLIYGMLKASQMTIANELDRTSSLYLLLAKLIESRSGSAAGGGYDYSSDTYVNHALQYIQFNFSSRKCLSPPRNICNATELTRPGSCWWLPTTPCSPLPEIPALKIPLPFQKSLKGCLA